MSDLQRKFNLLLDFAVNQCCHGEIMTISIEWDTDTPEKDLSVLWSMPKGAVDWSSTQCKEFCQSRQRQLQFFLPEEFCFQLYRLYFDANQILAHYYLSTVVQRQIEE
jgi:hypothetical protein